EVARAKALTPVTPPSRQGLSLQWTSDDAFVADDAVRQRSSRRVPSNKKVWVIAAAASIVLLVSSVFAFGVFGKSEKASSDATKSKLTEDAAADMTVVTNGPTGELRIESTPDGARVMVDGKESGFTPLTLNNVPAGRHLVVLEGENGT